MKMTTRRMIWLVALVMTPAGCSLPDPCEIDQDGDGVGNCEDTPCPKTPNYIITGEGQYITCVADDDQCPGDANKTTPGGCGCGYGEDPEHAAGDKSFTCPDAAVIDKCPYDDSKIQPGQCGCGMPDDDSDHDDAPDCTDECPLDGQKISKGICGCGVSDMDDADQDGSPDCVDECPDDPLKSEQGLCGCHHPEESGCNDDSDGDGIADSKDYCPHHPQKGSDPADAQNCLYYNDKTHVYEIWSASDLVSFKAVVDKQIPSHRLGFSCYDKDLYTFGGCVDDSIFNFSQAGETPQSQVASRCESANGIRKYVEYQCARFCKQTDESFECMRMVSAYDEKRTAFYSENGVFVGQKCENSPSSICYIDDSFAYQCFNDNGLKRIALKYCPYLCEDNVCKTCRGKAINAGGQVGDCCHWSYKEACDGDSVYWCDNGTVRKTKCMTGCETADGDSVATCIKASYTVNVHAKLMQDINIADLGEVNIRNGACNSGWMEMDLYQTELDGSGHAILFDYPINGKRTRCSLTRSLFDNIIESEVHDLKINIDYSEGAAAGLSVYTDKSKLSKLSFDSAVRVGNVKSKFKQYLSAFSMISSVAQNSLVENAEINSSMISEGYYSLDAMFYTADNLIINNSKIHLNKLQCTTPHCYGLAGYVRNSSLVNNSVIVDDMDLTHLNLAGVYDNGWDLYIFAGVSEGIIKSNIDHFVYGVKNIKGVECVDGCTFQGFSYDLNATRTSHLYEYIQNVDLPGWNFAGVVEEDASDGFCQFDHTDIRIDKVNAHSFVGLRHYCYGSDLNQVHVSLGRVSVENSIWGLSEFHHKATEKNLDYVSFDAALLESRSGNIFVFDIISYDDLNHDGTASVPFDGGEMHEIDIHIDEAVAPKGTISCIRNIDDSYIMDSSCYIGKGAAQKVSLVNKILDHYNLLSNFSTYADWYVEDVSQVSALFAAMPFALELDRFFSSGRLNQRMPDGSFVTQPGPLFSTADPSNFNIIQSCDYDKVYLLKRTNADYPFDYAEATPAQKAAFDDMFKLVGSDDKGALADLSDENEGIWTMREISETNADGSVQKYQIPWVNTDKTWREDLDRQMKTWLNELGVKMAE